jgi:hypothetical protein
MAIEGRRIAAERVIAARGGLGAFPDGPLVEVFDPIVIAEALEQQATRAMLVFEDPKVDLRMDAEDAIKLAAWLRQAPGR